MLASYLATYLQEKSDLHNFCTKELRTKFKKKSMHSHRMKGDKGRAKIVTGHNFQFNRFQSIFNVMLGLISPHHPEMKFTFQSMRTLSLLGEFLRGPCVV